ncbi:MAG: NAD-dependent epimerase/dehydratase family protein [Limnochordaceae bacterium]|nr:NAD-dependent epimerase/dehydratase family protein [Limnochordaceae bacterium]
MRALVTGGAGFIGSHVVERLLQAGWQVGVVDDLSTGQRANVPPGVQLHVSSLLDPELPEWVAYFGPDVVFHLAAQVKVSRSLAAPVRDAQINIEGSIRLLEACRQLGKVRRVVYASSAAVYGEPHVLPLPEEHPIHPLTPYGLSKYTVEQYLAIYRHLYGLSYTVLRYANVYGPRQDASGEGGVVAIFAERVSHGKAPVLFGDGAQTRDFVYASDVAQANLLAAQTPEADGQVFNIGTSQPIRIDELADHMQREAARLWGVPAVPRVHQAPRPGDIRDSCLDYRKAKEVLGWQPQVPLDEGLRRTLEWYRQQRLVGPAERSDR